MIYAFLRLGVVPLAFAGWVVYQLAFKKKKFSDISNDLLTISVFLVIWFLFIWFLFS